MTAATPGRLATAADLARLSPDVRAEILDGEIVEKAAPAPEHGVAQLALGAQIFGPFHRRAGGDLPGGWWLMTEVDVEYDPHQVYRHDLVGWRRERVPRRPTGTPVQTRPDWVCEVLSPSNARTDLVKKLRTLQKHEVPFYWILDPEHRTLTVLRWTPEGYLAALTAGAGDAVRAEPFEAVEIHLGVVFADADEGSP
ncbi:MAG: Uma2 family endonuclease [Polyangiaceae bacterium]|nr:Uma2 family endonuclease [Polyangiaceae bacterium]